MVMQCNCWKNTNLIHRQHSKTIGKEHAGFMSLLHDFITRILSKSILHRLQRRICISSTCKTLRTTFHSRSLEMGTQFSLSHSGLFCFNCQLRNTDGAHINMNENKSKFKLSAIEILFQLLKSLKLNKFQPIADVQIWGRNLNRKLDKW